MPRSLRDKSKPRRSGSRPEGEAGSRARNREGAGAAPPCRRPTFHAGAAPQRGRTLIELVVQSDLNLKYAYILRIADAVEAVFPLGVEGRRTLELCLNEALANAMVWGNGEDAHKQVRVRVWEEGGRWGYTVSDEGKGFKPSALPDYESEEFPLLERGRGIFLLLNQLSEVSFHDGGRTLVVKS